MDNEKRKYQIDRASLMYHEKPLEDDRVYSETFTSKYGYEFDRWFIDLTPSELLELCESLDTSFIIRPNDVSYDGKEYWSITIYDDYVE